MKPSSKLIAKLLTLCGITLTCTACYAPMNARYMYDAQIDGTIIADDTEEPIEGIQVSVEFPQMSYRGNDTIYYVERMLSDTAGMYTHRVPSDIPIKITAEDIDGTDNGGEFASQTQEMELSFPKQIRAEDDFYDYDYDVKATIDFRLEKIITQNPEEDEE